MRIKLRKNQSLIIKPKEWGRCIRVYIDEKNKITYVWHGYDIVGNVEIEIFQGDFVHVFSDSDEKNFLSIKLDEYDDIELVFRTE